MLSGVRGQTPGADRAKLKIWPLVFIAMNHAPSHRVGLIAPTTSDVRKVLIEGESGLLSCFPDSSRPTYEPSRRQVTFANGAVAELYSAEEGDRLRGPQHDGLWCDELATWREPEHVWDMAMFGLRLGKHPRAIVTTTPRPIRIIKELVKRDGRDVVITRGKTADNAANLAPTFMTQVVGKYVGTRLGRQELDAEILDDAPGALWSRDLLERTRCGPIAPVLLKRVVVAIDPAVSIGADANETGVIVAGLSEDGHFYILQDLSGKYQPIDWARVGVGAFKNNFADRIVAESNQGGAMVEGTIRVVDKSVPVRLVHASRGKLTRAEPVAALFEQNRAHLAGAFPELEDQLCTFEPGTPGSPDRMDAAVWALTELMTGGSRAELYFG
jgi:phage terminase large subunit-like protein